MPKKHAEQIETLTIDKLVHGGQGLATTAEGQKVFVWNALPGEVVTARVIKRKSSYLEAIAETIEQPSPSRLVPREENYLATSPWQIMDWPVENEQKQAIVGELFTREKVVLPALEPVIAGANEWHYRNKMEYSFWGDDEGLHLALHRRGSHGKQIVTGSELALPAIDTAANAICTQLNAAGIRAGDLKTIIVRCSQDGMAVAALFVKTETFTDLTLPAELQGLRVYYSNPKSPASVATRLLYELGSARLHDELLGKVFEYDVDSFFQVNIPVFEQALQTIKTALQGDPIDMYAGVGSIGLSVAERQVSLIELDPATAAMARVNAQLSGLAAEVIEASTEKVLDYIVSDRPVIFDPPRAGLHQKVVQYTLETKPPQIIYLSCNPATQARDLALLQAGYTIESFQVYNFFPRTPHIETLAILRKK